MKINVGSKNPVKLAAVKEGLQEHIFFENCEIQSEDVSSDVPSQPITANDTINGSKNRAKKAFSNCNISIGIESGLVPTPQTRTGYVGIVYCTIYDGQECYSESHNIWNF